MRRWIPAVAAALAVAALYVAITPDAAAPEAAGFLERDPDVAEARRELSARADSLRALTEAYSRARADTLAAFAPRSGPAFEVVTAGPVQPDIRAAIAEAFEAELRVTGAPRVPLRAVLYQDTSRLAMFSTHHVRPRVAGDPCVVVIRAMPPFGRNAWQDRRRLGVCGFYARHGMPGAGMQAWLDSTRAISAVADTILPNTRRADERRQSIAGSMVLALPSLAACVSGRDDACSAALLTPRSEYWNPRLPLRQTPRVVSDERRHVSAAFPWDQRDWPGDVLASLRQSLGASTFERIWTSELAPDAAYRAVTGNDFSTFARPYLLERMEPYRAGPIRADLSLLGAVAIAVAAALLAIRGTRRARS